MTNERTPGFYENGAIDPGTRFEGSPDPETDKGYKDASDVIINELNAVRERFLNDSENKMSWDVYVQNLSNTQGLLNTLMQKREIRNFISNGPDAHPRQLIIQDSIKQYLERLKTNKPKTQN